MSTLPRCKFWDKCYRKNPDHLKQYSHPKKADADEQLKDVKTCKQSVTDYNSKIDKKQTAKFSPERNDDGSGEDLQTAGSTSNIALDDSLLRRDRKRRVSDDCEKDDDEDYNQNAEEESTLARKEKNKKMKFDDETETRNEETIDGTKTELREEIQPSEEKKVKDENDEDDDSDDDFLTIVSTGKRDDSKSQSITGASPINGNQSFLSLPPKEMLKSKYSMEFPPDLLDFWNFCCSRSPLNPTKALAEGGLLLVGPFDLLAAKKSGREIPDDADLHLHWRFFFDPPEFMTIFAIVGADATDYEELEGLHYGYFRDDPKEMPAFLASSSKALDGTLTRVGGNLFAAAIYHLNSFTKIIDSKKRKQRIKELTADLTTAARSKGHQVGVETEAEKRRKKKVVAKPFHGVGMVVPFDKKTEVGYRELPETNSCLKKLFLKWCESPPTTPAAEDERLFARIQEILTFVQFANDECDYGMGLEMGLDLFTFGHDKFHRIVLSVLPLAYKLLDRPLFAEISENHLHNRTDSMVPKLF